MRRASHARDPFSEKRSAGAVDTRSAALSTPDRRKRRPGGVFMRVFPDALLFIIKLLVERIVHS
jgi:hypothetical protein